MENVASESDSAVKKTVEENSMYISTVIVSLPTYVHNYVLRYSYLHNYMNNVVGLKCHLCEIINSVCMYKFSVRTKSIIRLDDRKNFQFLKKKGNRDRK